MEGGARAARRAGLALLFASGITAASATVTAGELVIHAGSAPDAIEFTADVQEALGYLSRDTLLDDVLARAARVEIRHTGGRTQVRLHPATRSALVLFNPGMGIRIRGRRILSPALLLAHELGHVLRALRGVAAVHNGRFTTAEEVAVIEEIEQRVARLAGEPVRHAYVGTPVRVDDVTLGRAMPEAKAVRRPASGTSSDSCSAGMKKAASRRP